MAGSRSPTRILSLLAVNRAEGFRAGAQFYASAAAGSWGHTPAFVQPIQPRPIRELTIELEINRHHGDEERAADAAGKASAPGQQVAQRDLGPALCQQARAAWHEQALASPSWATQVTGPLPKQLVARQLLCRAAPVQPAACRPMASTSTSILKVQRPDRGGVPRMAPHRRRSASCAAGWACCWWQQRRAALRPRRPRWRQTLAHWDDKRDGEHTFPSNDRRRAAQRIASSRAAAFVLAHSTLTPPPAEPTVLKAES